MMHVAHREKGVAILRKRILWQQIPLGAVFPVERHAVPGEVKQYAIVWTHAGRHKVTEEMVCKEPDEEINDITIDYIKKFPTGSSFENYSPHITVASGDMDIKTESFEFASNEIALCHLGNYCTCRKILISHNLSGHGRASVV